MVLIKEKWSLLLRFDLLAGSFDYPRSIYKMQGSAIPKIECAKANATRTTFRNRRPLHAILPLALQVRRVSRFTGSHRLFGPFVRRPYGMDLLSPRVEVDMVLN